MNGILKGIRPLDYVLAGLMTAAGAFLMYENIGAGPGADLPHPVSTTSWLIVPTFLIVTVPILWRRRNVLAVVGVTAAATAAHVLAFDWLTRCGVLVPLTVALAYAVARFAGSWRNHVIGLAGIVVAQWVMLVRDSSIDSAVGTLPLVLALAALFYGIGLFVQNRASKKQAASAGAPAIERVAA
jgi:hypothetical protein